MQHPVKTSSMFGLRRSPKALSKAKLAPESLFLFGGLLPFWPTTVFWIPVLQLYMRCMLSRSMRCTIKCKACSRHLSTKRAQFFSPTMLNHTSDNQCFKSWTNGLWNFASFVIFTWPLANWLPLLQVSQQLFSGKMLPQPAGHRKCFLRVCQIPKPVSLCYRNKLISCWQKYVDCNVSYFD